MNQLRHENVVELKSSFYMNGEKDGDIYLNLVLEYIPHTVYKVCRTYAKEKKRVPTLFAKVMKYENENEE